MQLSLQTHIRLIPETWGPYSPKNHVKQGTKLDQPLENRFVPQDQDLVHWSVAINPPIWNQTTINFSYPITLVYHHPEILAKKVVLL